MDRDKLLGDIWKSHAVNGIPVFKTHLADQSKLFTMIKVQLYPPSGCVIVHPSRWEEFFYKLGAELERYNKENTK